MWTADNGAVLLPSLSLDSNTSMDFGSLTGKSGSGGVGLSNVSSAERKEAIKQQV